VAATLAQNATPQTTAALGVIGHKELMKAIGKILGIVWFIAFGGFIVLKFLPNEDKSEFAINYAEKFEEYLQWFLSSPLFFVLFIAMWLFVSFRLGKDSGWTKLAEAYSKSYVEPANSKFVTGSAYIGKVSHNRMLKVAADEAGFYIKAIFPFKFGHKSLQIPWSEIASLKEEEALVSPNTPGIVKNFVSSFTRKKHMKIELRAYPEQNLVIHWEHCFNEYVPVSVARKS